MPSHKKKRQTSRNGDHDYGHRRRTSSPSPPPPAVSFTEATIDSFAKYYLTIMEYVSDEHWLATETIAPLLSLQHDHCRCPFLQVEDVNSSMPHRPFVEGPMDSLVAMHVAVNYYVSRGRFYTAYNLQIIMLRTFLTELLQKNRESNWYIPLLSILCSDLRLLAKKAQAQDRDPEPEPYMEDVANLIMTLYRTCVTDSQQQLWATRKVAIVPLTVELFRLYFDMNKMALLKPLIRSVENLNTGFTNLVSVSDLVAYNYFLGKKAIFDGDMSTANRALQHAFENCPERFQSSRRAILIYWLPAKLSLGCVPDYSLLEKFDLLEFGPILEGVNHGDIKKFRQGLNDHSAFFIKSGIFLILEKLTALTQLALFKQLQSIMGTPRIKLDAFLHLLRFVGEDVADTDEAGNIIAGLIASGRVRGYISQTHQVVVLSKKDPFAQGAAPG